MPFEWINFSVPAEFVVSAKSAAAIRLACAPSVDAFLSRIVFVHQF
jgi:hypothetical protein